MVDGAEYLANSWENLFYLFKSSLLAFGLTPRRSHKCVACHLYVLCVVDVCLVVSVVDCAMSDG